MRKLIYLLFLISGQILAQSTTNLPTANVQQVYRGDTIKSYFNGDTAKFYTDKAFFKFNKQIIGTGADSSVFSTKTYTNRQIAAATTGLVDPRGQWDASTGTFPSTGGSGTAGAILKGDYWSISVEGTIGGVSYTVGSSLLAMVDNPGQTAENWDKQITGSTLAVRTFEDINSGVPAYSGTTLVNGQFFGGNSVVTGTKRGGFNGVFNVGNVFAYNSLGAAALTGYGGSQQGVIGSTTTGTPIYATKLSASGNFIECYRGGILASIDYNGKLTANGANFGTNTTSNDFVTLNNNSTGNGIYIYNLSTGIGNQIYNYSTGVGTEFYNNSTGIGCRIYNISTGIGLKIHNYSSGDALEIDSVAIKKFKIDIQGDIHNDPPHASSWFADSSRLITLTQNTWTGITNTWKKLYPSTGANYYFNKITKTGDSCKITKAGRYEIIYELNATGTANATYEYRLCKRSGSTITYYNKQVLVGTGATVVRIVSGSLPLIANDVVWAEVRTTTTGNNSITVIGGQIRIKTIKLDL